MVSVLRILRSFIYMMTVTFDISIVHANKLRGAAERFSAEELNRKAIISDNKFNGTSVGEQIRDLNETLLVETGPFDGPMISMIHNNIFKEKETGNRIIGGSDAGPHSFYAMLLYVKDSQWKWAGCGATLISNCYVTTAAHCIKNEKNINIEGIFINAHAPYNNNDGKPFFFSYVKETTVHENYQDITNEGDIALIKMELCLDIDTFPPAEPAKEEYSINSGDGLEVFGFGATSSPGYSELPQRLQSVDVPFITKNDCKQYYGSSIKNDMICAGLEEGGKDACQGDSGSGLIRKESNGKYKQIGVVSWGNGCGLAGNPGVYASISHYFDWLHNIVCRDSDTKASWCNVSSEGYYSSSQLPDIPMQLLVTPLTSPPTMYPTSDPTSKPSISPTSNPTSKPSISPTSDPTSKPSKSPTSDPTYKPSTSPTGDPTYKPSTRPTGDPTYKPSISPTDAPAVATSASNKCKIKNEACTYGHQCCSGKCVASMFSQKKCIVPAQIAKDSFGNGRGGSGSGRTRSDRYTKKGYYITP